MECWIDFGEGDAFPESRNFVRALNRPLKTPTGLQEQFVALSYRHGRPLMGRAFKDKMNRIQTSFADNGRESNSRSLGTFQLLEQIPSSTTGLVYDWKPFGAVAKNENKEWRPFHISNITPCVLLLDEGFEILGSLNLKQEVAESTTAEGKVIKYCGREIQNFPILVSDDCIELITSFQCVKAFHDTMEI